MSFSLRIQPITNLLQLLQSFMYPMLGICVMGAIFLSGCTLEFENEKPVIPVHDNGSPFYEEFEDSLDTAVWQVATWREHGGQTGRERCFTEDGFLNMVFINDSEEGYLNASINTRDEFLYGTWEARLKPSGVPGVLNSFFTIDWNDEGNGDGTKQEVDIEFLTNSFGPGSGQVHFAVHAEGLTSYHTNPDIELDFNPSEDFHVWGFDITPSYIEWFVDDRVLRRYTYSEYDIAITDPYMLKLNVWTSTNWVGGPPDADVSCTYLIDWIRFTPAE